MATIPQRRAAVCCACGLPLFIAAFTRSALIAAPIGALDGKRSEASPAAAAPEQQNRRLEPGRFDARRGPNGDGGNERRAKNR
jgi:hypothetical protein